MDENEDSGLFYRDLKSEVDMTTSLLREADEEIKRLKSAVALQKKTIATRDEEIDRIRTALKPFAAYADALDLDEIPNTTKVKYGELAPGIIALHFRRARVALKPLEAEIKGGYEKQ